MLINIKIYDMYTTVLFVFLYCCGAIYIFRQSDKKGKVAALYSVFWIFSIPVLGFLNITLSYFLLKLRGVIK